MAVDLVGLNLSALNSITPPTISINQTATAILRELPSNANEITGGFFPYLVLIAVFVITYWYISDKNPLSEFKYSDIRALALSFAITGSLGLTQLAVGFIESWMAVVLFILASVLSTVILIIMENKQ